MKYKSINTRFHVKRLVYTRMDQFGLRIKIYIVNCHKHPLHEDADYFADNPEYGEGVQVIGYSYQYMAFSTHIGTTTDSSADLEHTKCIGYSCVVVLINSDCDCRTKILRKLLTAMKNNPNLRYKSKLIMATYTKKLKYRRIWGRDLSEVFFKKHMNNLKKASVGCCSSSLLHPDQNCAHVKSKKNPFKILQSYVKPKISKIFQKPNGTKFNDDRIKNITKDDRNPVKDHYYFNQIKLDNAIFMQSFINRDSDRGHEIDTLLFQIYRSPLRSMQKVLVQNSQILGHFRIIQTPTNADLYFCSINPALAIIINNYYFTNSTRIREGSERDVIRLIRELKIAGIPYILLQDYSNSKLLQIMDSIERIDFSPLKSFLFFIMSHGGSNDIIYSHDGKLNVKTDIVGRIQSNQSLKNAETLILVKSCRGTLDPQYADYDDMDSIQPTDAGHLDSNTVVMYSVPDNVMSPRCRTHGSPYMTSFCQHFRYNDNLLKIDGKIDGDLKGKDCYVGLDKRSELVANDPQKYHYITEEPTEATKVIQLIERILREFPTLNGHRLQWEEDEANGQGSTNLFYIDGALRQPTETEISFADQYFAPVLDADECLLDNESPLERCSDDCDPSKQQSTLT